MDRRRRVVYFSGFSSVPSSPTQEKEQKPSKPATWQIFKELLKLKDEQFRQSVAVSFGLGSIGQNLPKHQRNALILPHINPVRKKVVQQKNFIVKNKQAKHLAKPAYVCQGDFCHVSRNKQKQALGGQTHAKGLDQFAHENQDASLGSLLYESGEIDGWFRVKKYTILANRNAF